MHAMKPFTRAYKKRFGMTDRYQLLAKTFWDHVIRDENDLENHFHYIHYNLSNMAMLIIHKLKHSSYQQWMSIGVYTGGNWQNLITAIPL